MVVLPAEPVMATTGTSLSRRLCRARSARARVVSATWTRGRPGTGSVTSCTTAAGRPPGLGFLQEGVAVEAGTRDRDEQVAGPERPRIDGHALERGSEDGGRGRLGPASRGGRDQRDVEHRERHPDPPQRLAPFTSSRPRSSRATWRSSKGTVRSRSTW